LRVAVINGVMPSLLCHDTASAQVLRPPDKAKLQHSCRSRGQLACCNMPDVFRQRHRD